MLRTRIFIADDHVIVREGLALLINAQLDMLVVGVASDGRELIEKLGACDANLVVMDVSMPKMNGVEATALLAQQCPEIKVVALSRHSEPAYVRQLMQAGARGYVLKQADSSELLAAIRAVHSGSIYLDSTLAGRMAGQFAPSTLRQEAPRAELSERETAVMQLIAQGYSNKEIAAQLYISTKTVETYKARAMEKLGLSSRVALLRYALHQGWLDLS
jgi:DNA-binding NarL/FixJ family response regulator